MDKLILSVLALAAILGVTYAIQFHFDDFLFWLAGDAPQNPNEVTSIGPYSKNSNYASFK